MIAFKDNYRLARWQAAIHRRSRALAFAALGVLSILVYLPSIFSTFISDDYEFLSLVFFHSAALVNGAYWTEWFWGSINGYVYFRPFGHTLFLVDYLIGQLNSLGYHLTSVVCHILTTWLVYLLAQTLLRRRAPAFFLAIVFAVLPVHVAAVAEPASRYDIVMTFWFLAAFLFFVLYRRHAKSSLYIAALIAFVCALSSKELAITLPVVLLLYDLMEQGSTLRHGTAQTWMTWFKAHMAFWVIVPLYLMARLIFLGRIIGSPGSPFAEAWQFWQAAFWQNTLDPLPAESVVIAVTLIGLVLAWMFVPARRTFLLGVVWIPLTFALSLPTAANDYSFYLASFGVALILGTVFAALPIHDAPIWQTGISFVMIALLGVPAFLLAQEYRRATDVASAIVEQVQSDQPTLPPNAHLVFVGVPDKLPSDVLVYRSGFSAALRIAYANPALDVRRFNKFPIWLDELDRTFFFLVDHRRVYPRVDIAEELRQRRQCESNQQVNLTWNFASDTQGWEAWSQILDFDTRADTLTMRVEGTDPILGSPPVDVPTLQLGDFELTMRAQADQPKLQGELYWQVTDQNDFSPDLRQPFAVQADGEWHTYRINLAASGKLLIGDHLTRFRLDPVNAPAQIEIRSIQVYTVCLSNQGLECNCLP